MNNNINNDFKTNIIPVVTYSNAHLDKLKVYGDNEKKSGIYRWVNNINNKSYIGSLLFFKSYEKET